VSWSASVSWCISINQAAAPDRVLLLSQLDLCSILLNNSFSQDHAQLDKDSLPCSVKCPNNFHTTAARNQNVQRTQAAQNSSPADRRCYAYGEKGHFANQCPNPCGRSSQIDVCTPAPTHGANSIPVAMKQNYARGRVNHVAVKEAQETPNVVISMFFINDTSAIVLFDSRASHSFISSIYVEKHNLPIALLKCQMIVSSPGGDMPARQLCPKVNLKIKGVDFVANLIILESKGIIIILGMDRLSKHKVLIDCAKKSIKLTTSDRKEF
jgi:hypothetical protein